MKHYMMRLRLEQYLGQLVAAMLGTTLVILLGYSEETALIIGFLCFIWAGIALAKYEEVKVKQ